MIGCHSQNIKSFNKISKLLIAFANFYVIIFFIKNQEDTF